MCSRLWMASTELELQLEKGDSKAGGRYGRRDREGGSLRPGFLQQTLCFANKSWWLYSLGFTRAFLWYPFCLDVVMCSQSCKIFTCWKDSSWEMRLGAQPAHCLVWENFLSCPCKCPQTAARALHWVKSPTLCSVFELMLNRISKDGKDP